jgi:hypothetical protein
VEIDGIIIYAFITIFSFGLLVISAISYHKYKTSKLVFISFVFLVIFIKSLFLSSTIFNPFSQNILSNPLFSMFDLAVLVLLFLATLKR